MMSPEIFQDYALGLVKNAPGVQQAQTLDAVGEYRYLHGIALVVDGRESRWQIVGQPAPGGTHDTLNRPDEGQPAAYITADSSASADAWLAGVIGADRSPHIERLDVWSARRAADPGNLGFAVHFHNGQRVFVRKI